MTAFKTIWIKGWWLPSLFLLIAVPIKAEPLQPYFKATTQLYSPSISLLHIEDWRGQHDSKGDIALASGWLESGVKTPNNWRHGLVYRFDKSYQYSPATSELYYQIQNHKSLKIDKHYSLKLHLSEFRAHGFRVAKTMYYANNHQIEAGVSILKADRLMYADIQGNAHILTESSYDYSVQANYQYYRDTLFGRTDFTKPKGRGYTIDFSFLGQINQHLYYQLHIKDAFGKLYWQEAPHTIGQAQPVKTYTDADGYFHAESALSGQEGYKTLYQKLKLAWVGTVHYKKYKYTLDIGAQSLGDGSQLGFGLSMPISNWAADTSLFYWSKSKELVVSVNKKPWTLYLGTNSTQSNQINALRIGLDYAY
ncbi:MAG: hypothetical protein P8J25_03575 [Porticoccaceae bacterium]|nr:hypothetical protein [Porticoccaceae bacterium]